MLVYWKQFEQIIVLHATCSVSWFSFASCWVLNGFIITVYWSCIYNVIDLGYIFENSSHSLWYITYISGPVLVMVLEKINAVADWRTLIGPTDAQKAKVTHPHRLFMFLLIMTIFCLIFSLAILLVLLSYECWVCIQFD